MIRCLPFSPVWGNPTMCEMKLFAPGGRTGDLLAPAQLSTVLALDLPAFGRPTISNKRVQTDAHSSLQFFNACSSGAASSALA